MAMALAMANYKLPLPPSNRLLVVAVSYPNGFGGGGLKEINMENELIEMLKECLEGFETIENSSALNFGQSLMCGTQAERIRKVLKKAGVK